MSFVFSKNKEKRSRSSTGESNSSFVKNVTSRVTGFLPAGITKWFSSPSSSSGNGSAPTADGTDSSTEDEAPESPSMVQPPAKRLRYSSPIGKYSSLTTTETTTTSNVITETGSVLYNSIQSPLGRQTFRRESNFVSTPIRAEDTMNLNSMIDRSDRENPYVQHTVSAIGHSIAMKRKSLFDTNKQKEQSLIACAQTAAHQVKDIKQPYFKPHLLGSPFYPGQTMYGGASASSSYLNHPNIKQRKMTYVNESRDADTVNMSSSSRRVMDLLENYSSPLIEAKRIPRYELSEFSDINRSIQPSLNSTSNSYKKQELYVPSTATMIRLKARSRLMDSTKAARQIIASHSSTLSYQPYVVDNAKQDLSDDIVLTKSQSKLKSRLTRPNRGVEDQFVMPETVELPTAVLQIDVNNLPKFSFGGSAEKQTDKASYELFKFSTPLPVTPDTKATDSRPPLFDFISPVKAADNASPSKFSFPTEANVEESKTEQLPEKKDEPAKADTEKSLLAFAKTTNDWKCSDCWVSNKTEAKQCACCGAKKPSQQSAAAPKAPTNKCTTCKLSDSQPNSDKCVNCDKMRASLPLNSLPIVKKANTSKWTCGDCWVDNDDLADKCICCGSRNPRKGAPPTGAPKPVAPVSTEKDWRCEDCLITNKPAKDKCVACGGAKPGTKSATNTYTTNFSTAANNKMQEIIEVQKSYWECNVCLASNANEKTSCMCCEALRFPEHSDKPEYANFKFKKEINSSFKFGIDPKEQETNLAKKVEFSIPKNREESETNNNIVPKSTSFHSFTLPAENSGDKLDGQKVDEPKPSFSFGIPQQNTTPVSTGFSFPMTAPAGKLPDIVKPAEDKEKPQEVPSISFMVSDEAKPTTGMFGSRAPSDNPQNAMNAFLNNSNFNNSAETNKTVSPIKPAAQPSAMLEAPKSQFSFSAVKPSTGGLFTSPASTASLTNSITTQAAPAPAATGMGMFAQSEANPAGSFFGKPEAKLPPTSTPFQNNVQSTPAVQTATPLFSFGNNQSANPAPANEVKGFTFTFGSTASTPAFGAAPTTTPAFGAAPTSTFGMPNANPMTNGPTNPLGGNGVAANPLGQSIMGNPLGGSGNGNAPNGSGMQVSGNTSMFTAPAKETTSMWPTTTEQPNQVNPFMANAAPKDQPFSFRATSTPLPFGVQASGPAKEGFTFGATQAPSPFGAPSNNTQMHVFGSNAPPPQNMFGMNQDNQSQQPMFGSSQPTPMFGSVQPAMSAPAVPMFGAPSSSPFGAPAPMSTFDSPSMSPAPAPSFNFGASQSTPSVFGFGQQSQMQQPQMMGMQQQAGIQPGMYNFGGASSPAPVQFNMGSAPSTGSSRRPVRKAVRRTQQR